MSMKRRGKTYRFYAVLLLAVCGSLVFTNLGYDGEYQLAMGYRMIRGDEMLSAMWEPHQTSAFLCAILMKLYMMVTGTTTGIVLFTQMAGLMIRAGISVWMYRAFRRIFGDDVAITAGLLYFLISPKDILTPEFSNMQLWFGTVMFLALVEYFERRKVWLLVLAAFGLCLSVLSYPSFILAYGAAVLLLWRYSSRKGRDIGLFTAVCALVGGFFAGQLLWRIGLSEIMNILEHALALEPSHTVDAGTKSLGHVRNLLQIAGMLAAIGGIGFVVCVAAKRLNSLLGKASPEVKRRISLDDWVVCSWYVLQVFFLINILSVENRGGYGIPMLVMVLWGFANRHRLGEQEHRVYMSALWVGGISLVATMILSDHPFIQAVPYMLVAVCASVAPIFAWARELAEDGKGRVLAGAMHLFLLLLIFRSLFLHVPIYGRGQICSVLDDLALIRSGPAIGIITDEEGAARQRDSMAEWQQYIEPGDIIWILGEPVDTLGYLYEEVEVGAPTVMSTPTYNEHLLYYWESNPDKYPDVVILSSSFGELSWDLLRNEWLMTWLEEEYCAQQVIDGNYWRYYFR